MMDDGERLELLGALGDAILRIRMVASNGDATRCLDECSLIHSIPNRLKGDGWIASIKMDDAVRLALLDVLSAAILRMRVAAIDSNTERCFIEADHVQDLPSILKYRYWDEVLRFYWKTPRALFLQRSADVSVERFDESWRAIEPFTHEAAEQR